VWAAPGRRAVAEYDEDGLPRAALVTLDYGATRQRIKVANNGPDQLTN
jgi:hypothetical protein